ncbi:MAG TPA: NUDIX hydrolase [Pseudolysinimonas sp.]|nr:NUDIX hydrolase [Pseudolysinimonas sp.]
MNLTDSGDWGDRFDPADVTERETVFTGRVWNVVRESATFHDDTIVREYTEHPGAVAVLVFDEHDRVLLINQYRHPIGTRDWEIPAGLLDVEGEEPLLAAQRELAEETDLIAEEWSAPMRIAPSPGGSSEVIHLFEARGLRAAPTVHERTDEEAEIELLWVTLDEARAAVLEGRVANGILIIAILSALAKRA